MVASPNPSEAAIQAWARLVRVSGALLDAVEAELKAAGFPPLVWYDALLELGRAPEGRLRPFELERHMLLPQYSTSRLVDRLDKAGLVERVGCPDDRRGQHVSITDAGRALRERMWPAYAAAIQRHMGSKIGCTDAQKLAELLGRLSARGCDGALCEGVKG
ncbi:MAG: MarR family winged helix-turn-helix transcriptional regulator [Microvirga sp.]|jgi:DNA-binding MarR family transcriptional regulator|nr:MarR family winged helix-turn-helix transcriptional regulator [Beijerinckiaceae bacterium]